MKEDNNIILDSGKENILISINRKINEDSESSGKMHKKMQSFEISNEIEFNKQFPYKDREQTIQAYKSQRLSESSKNNTSQIIVEHIESNEISSKDLAKTKTEKLDKEFVKKNNKLYFYNIIPFNYLKLITIIMMIIYMIIVILGIIFYYIKKDEKPFLFSFNFIKRKDEKEDDEKIKESEILFLADINSFCIIHIALFIIFVKILITFIIKLENDIKHFLKFYSIFLDLTLLVNIPVFILGITSDYYDNEDWKNVLCIILTGLGTFFMLTVYIRTKSIKFKNVSRLINQGILSGILTCFELYSLIYNICYFITVEANLNNIKLEMIPGSIFFVFSFFFTVFYKDIIFSITALIIEIGLLYIKRNGTSAFSVGIFNVSVVFFNFASIILIIFKYNTKVFKFIENVEIGKKE